MARQNLMGWPITVSVVLLVMAALAVPAGAEDVLLATQEPLTLGGDLVLVIEDVDSQKEMVWISLYREEIKVQSAVLGLGEHLLYGDLNLAVRRIYAGGGGDLVALEVSGMLPASGRSPPGNASRSLEEILPQSPGPGALLSLLAVLAAALIRPA